MDETHESQLPSSMQHVKREIYMLKITNPSMTNKVLKAWVKTKFKPNIHEATISIQGTQAKVQLIGKCNYEQYEAQ